MVLPRDLITGNYVKPRIFLCDTNKEKMCILETTNTHASLKFNSYSELSFEVGRVYSDIITGEQIINNYYDLIESPRIICLDNIGHFEIQGPELSSDGIKEAKIITAYSLEYTLSQKYLTNFIVNTGQIGSIEVTYHELNPSDALLPIVFYDPTNKELSLLDLALEKIHGWKIGHVDESLCKLSRTFEIDRMSVYDFLMNEVCQKFNCYIVFDTISDPDWNIINVYAEPKTQRFVGDDSTIEFIISPPMVALGYVTINNEITTDYSYDSATGKLTFNSAPVNNTIIEITDHTANRWETDVFITFNNLSQDVKVNYDADNIKTVLTVKGADDLDIREVNMGLDYIVDLSYYCSPKWLGQDLYDAYMGYLKHCNIQQKKYESNSQKINKIYNQKLYEENRVSLEGIDIVIHQKDVTSETYGKYFIREGTEPNYYYREVSLPDEYKEGQQYYLFDNEGVNLTETGVTYLYHALQTYFQKYFNESVIDVEALDNCAEYFSFATEDYAKMCDILRNIVDFIPVDEVAKQDALSTLDDEFIFACVNRFFNQMWEQLGSYPLTYCYRDTYLNLQSTALEASWGEITSAEYGSYFALYLIVQTLEKAYNLRNKRIDELEEQIKALQSANAEIGRDLDLNNYFRANYFDSYNEFMVRLSAFLREDEYTDDNFVATGQETIEELYQLKRELKECGQIELSHLSQPTLQFSMSMANIYALPEFEPIVYQFQLGNVIKVGIREGYIKQARLLQVDMGLDDFSDFSCEFGELTTPRTQSDLHADLLSQAISAGKQVASNASYWNRGTDQANSIDLRLQRGLIDAATSIKSMDGNQGVEIDNYGIHLRKTNQTTGKHDPEQGWLTNNKFLYSHDGFKTVQSVFGKYTIDGEDYWGLLAKAVVAGYIEGSKIRGGTIDIGDGAFWVDENGNVGMGGKNTINGYTTDAYVKEIQTDLQGQIDGINNTKMYRVEIYTSDSLIIDNPNQTATLTCKIYSWDTDITEQYKGYIRWIRTSNDIASDDVWNSQSSHKGVPSITIGSSDIAVNASFHCEVDMPD